MQLCVTPADMFVDIMHVSHASFTSLALAAKNKLKYSTIIREGKSYKTVQIIIKQLLDSVFA